MMKVWGIRKRLWGKNWHKEGFGYSTNLYGQLGYGAEIWCWKKRCEIEGVHDM